MWDYSKIMLAAYSTSVTEIQSLEDDTIVKGNCGLHNLVPNIWHTLTDIQKIEVFPMILGKTRQSYRILMPPFFSRGLEYY